MGQRADVNKALKLLKKGRVVNGVLSPEAGTSVERMRAANDAVNLSWQRYSEAFSRARTDSSDAICDIARDGRFREAITWQNRSALHSGIESSVAKTGRPRPRLEGQEKRNPDRELLAAVLREERHDRFLRADGVGGPRIRL